MSRTPIADACARKLAQAEHPEFYESFKPVADPHAHQWVSDDPVSRGSARCRRCGLYVVATADVALGVAAVLVVGGRYINGGLHLTPSAARERYSPEKHGRCKP